MHSRHGQFVAGMALVCLAVMGGATVLTAANPDPYVQAKATFLKEIRKKPAETRCQALIDLAEFPRRETVDLIQKRGLIDPDPTVRQAARVALRKMTADRGIAELYLTELRKLLKAGPPKPRSDVGLILDDADKVTTQILELVRALAVLEDPSRQEEFLKLIDDSLSDPRTTIAIPMRVIDDYAQQGDAEALQAVKLLARAKATEKTFGYRRCVVQAYAQIRDRDTIGNLIELLPSSSGLIQHDIVQSLTKLTQQKFRDNHRDWSIWWKGQRETFQLPPVEPPPVAGPVTAQEMAIAAAALDGQPTYYGIPIGAKRVVFVLDTSASMRGQPIEAAKDALIKTIGQLPEPVTFNVLMFDRRVYNWQPRLVPATNHAKSDAAGNIMNKGMDTATASNAALYAAFAQEPEVIYFLSDGEPTDADPRQIIQTISQLNRTRRVSIHAIGVITDRSDGAGLTRFMAPLASQNWGKFLLIQ